MRSSDTLDPSCPNWQPLQQAVAVHEWYHFMYMGRCGKIEAYKHVFTRRYLYIDADTGDFFRYTPERFLHITREEALGSVLAPSSYPC